MKNKTNRTKKTGLIVVFFVSAPIFLMCAYGMFGNPIKDLWLMFIYTIFNISLINNITKVKDKIWRKLLVFTIFEILPIGIYAIIITIKSLL